MYHVLVLKYIALAAKIPLLRKLRELRSERDFLRDQLGKFDQGRRKVSQDAREREELLARRHAVSAISKTDIHILFFFPHSSMNPFIFRSPSRG